MNWLHEVLNEKIINALGWSIFHILWQGILISLILVIVLFLLRNKTSQTRYLVAFSSLLLLIGLSVFNFKSNYKEIRMAGDHETSLTVNNENSISIIEFKGDEFNSLFNFTGVKSSIKKLDRYFPFIVNIWLTGVLIFAIKFILSYFYTNRLKHVQKKKIPGNWINRFNNIKEKLKVNKSIRYLESRLTKIPLVLGYFKPVIVIPVEMLTGMPINQIEAIIAHEIAHIRRNDYILNVLQTTIETVFFFHPAVWYISAQIRKERENCCDDLALTVCKESLVYAKALVSVQELTLKKHYSAVAFSGKKKHLLNRIKRMIMKPKTKSNFTDKILAAIIILSGVLALSFTYAAKTTNYTSEESVVQSVSASENNAIDVKTSKQISSTLDQVTVNTKDTVRVKKHQHNEIEVNENKITKTYKENGEKHRIEFKLKDGKAYDLYVDGEKIQEKDYPKYQKDIDKTIEDLEEAKEEIREAMKDIEEIDYEHIQKEVEEAMKDIHIDIAGIQEEIAEAMEEIHTIDVEDIMKEVEMNIKHLEDMDYDFDFDLDRFNIELGEIDIDLGEIKEEMEKTREAIKENIDMEAIKREMYKVQEELSRIDKEKLHIELEEGLKNFEEYDKQEVIKELQEKLEELEKLELEEK